ncbi:hypothetical protein D3C72_2008060 [compost metagenome]
MAIKKVPDGYTTSKRETLILIGHTRQISPKLPKTKAHKTMVFFGVLTKNAPKDSKLWK